MNKQDIELIAAALRVARLYINEKEPAAKRAALLKGVSHAANFLAVMLNDCSKRFDPQSFLVSCGNEVDDAGRPILPNHCH